MEDGEMLTTTRPEIRSSERDRQRSMFRVEEPYGTPPFLRQDMGSRNTSARNSKREEES